MMRLTGKRKPQFFHGGADALARLLDRRVRQTDQFKGRQARADVAFRLHPYPAMPARPSECTLLSICIPPLSLLYLYHTAFPAKNQPVFLFRGSAGRNFESFPQIPKRLFQI